MNYQKIYNDLIFKAKSENRRKLKRDDQNYVYYEKHHIIPRCLGGNNKSSNLVLLYPREHYICHKLLVEIYPKEKGLIHAMIMMCKCDRDGQRNYIVSSREFQRYRELFVKDMSIRIKGENNPMYGKVGEKNPFFGKHHSEELVIGFRLRAKNRKKAECPWCHKIMNNVNAQQYHFDNCMMNPNVSEEKVLKRKNRTIPAKLVSHSKLICPHCGVSASHTNSKKYHFENCIHAPVLSEYTINRLKERDEDRDVKKEKLRLERESREIKIYKCEHCGYETESLINFNKWHGDNCTNNPNCKRHIYTCYKCGTTSTNKTNITRFHNDNCGKMIRWKSKISNQ